jgi:hypothetical protein
MNKLFLTCRIFGKETDGRYAETSTPSSSVYGDKASRAYVSDTFTEKKSESYRRSIKNIHLRADTMKVIRKAALEISLDLK